MCLNLSTLPWSINEVLFRFCCITNPNCSNHIYKSIEAAFTEYVQVFLWMALFSAVDFNFRSFEIWFTSCPSVDMITEICLCKSKSGFLRVKINGQINLNRAWMGPWFLLSFISVINQTENTSDVKLYFVDSTAIAIITVGHLKVF